MGSGVLKTLSSYKVSEDQFLDVFSCGGHSPKPRICLLLWRLGVCSSSDDFVPINTSVVYHHLASLAGSLDPVLSVVLAVVIPRMLGTVATKMSLFMTRVTRNLA